MKEPNKKGEELQKDEQLLASPLVDKDRFKKFPLKIKNRA